MDAAREMCMEKYLFDQRLKDPGSVWLILAAFSNLCYSVLKEHPKVGRNHKKLLF